MSALNAPLFVAVSLVYGLTTLSAAMPRWLVLYGWAVIACVVFALSVWRNRARVDQIDLLALSLLGWAALSLLWSADRLQGVMEITNGAALCAVFMWVRRYPEWIPEAAMVALAGTLALQWYSPGEWGGHGNMNFQTEAILLLLALSSQYKKDYLFPVFLALLACSVAYLVLVNPSKIEWLVLIVVGIFHVRRLSFLHYRTA